MELEKINLYFTSIFPPPYGGVGVWNERILKTLRQNENFALTVYSTREKEFLEKKAISHKIPIFKKIVCFFHTYSCLLKDMLKGDIGFREYLSTLKFAVMISSILGQVDSDLDYCLYISHASLFTLAMIYVFSFLNSSKIILHEHGFGAIEYAIQRPNIVRFILNKVDKVVVASNYMKEVCIKDGCERDKICVLPCGIYAVDQPFPEKENLVMFCGSLEQQKDPITFIKAIPIVLELLRTGDIQFVLIGEGSLKEVIQEEVSKLGIEKNVILKGPLPNDEVLTYFRKAKLFVLPSVREPFGIVLLEAMNNYTPCVVTNVGGMPEIVNDSFGKVVKEKSPEQLAHAIVEIMKKDDDQYKEMSIKAYNASKAYDMTNIGKSFHDLCKRVCE